MRIPLTRQFGQFETAMQTMTVLLALIFILGFAYILVMLSVKLLGIVILLGGLWLLVYFPWQADYQRAVFSKTGITIGIIMIAAGLALLLYG